MHDALLPGALRLRWSWGFMRSRSERGTGPLRPLPASLPLLLSCGQCNCLCPEHHRQACACCASFRMLAGPCMPIRRPCLHTSFVLEYVGISSLTAAHLCPGPSKSPTYQMGEHSRLTGGAGNTIITMASPSRCPLAGTTPSFTTTLPCCHMQLPAPRTLLVNSARSWRMLASQSQMVSTLLSMEQGTESTQSQLVSCVLAGGG
jgi:hypothetical protein